MYQTPSEYVRNKWMRENTLFSIINGTGFYRPYHGPFAWRLVPQKEFEALFPLMEKVRAVPLAQMKGESSDKRQIL